jgi:hypothetical protein
MPKTDNRDNDRLPGSDGRVCAYCGQPVPAGQDLMALVLDSSGMAPQDISLDGQRLVTACGNDHVAALAAQGRRAWVEEQRSFGRLCRASVQPGMRRASVSELGERAGMSARQLAEALDWNAGATTPQTVLPGGQSLPVGGGITGEPEGQR